MLLTDSQRKWVDMLKEAAKRKAPVQAIRPQVSLIEMITGYLLVPRALGHEVQNAKRIIFCFLYCFALLLFFYVISLAIIFLI